MVATLADMVTRIARDTGLGTSFAQEIKDSIVAAIRLHETEPLWFLQDRTTLTLQDGDISVSLPDDFKAHISLRVLVNGRWMGERHGFKSRTFNELLEENTDDTNTGYPETWALFGSRIYVNRTADDDYDLDLPYIKGDVAYPSADSDSSVWFDEGFEVIRLEATAIFLRDRVHATSEELIAAIKSAETGAAEHLETLQKRSTTRLHTHRLS